MFLRSKSIETLTDEDLVARLKSGHRSSLGALWDRYAQLLFGVAMKYLRDVEKSKDLVVEVFGTLPDLIAKHEIKSFRPWLHTVMRNRCLMLLRKDDPSTRWDERVHEPEAEDPTDAVLHETTLQRLEAAVDQLNEAQGLCIRYFYLERNSYAQVAERTGFSLEHVRSHLQNGRRNLKNILLDHSRRTGEQRHADQNR
jgi:RNA polymerase sigma factor (sigma-70 family)